MERKIYTVRIFKTTWNKEEDEVRCILEESEMGAKRTNELKPSGYFYDVTLEFPPFPRPSISSGKCDSGEIKRVQWSMDEKCVFIATFKMSSHGRRLIRILMRSSCTNHVVDMAGILSSERFRATADGLIRRQVAAEV